ncbi:MAG: hypothetical protein QHH27_03245 [Clostridia bacterium]|nr:hypothetical protein [Clostridia bacterium]MDH7572552.1 hypothetical protein [Clostridia bacterium]
MKTLPYVFVLPGNHDPLLRGGVWDRPDWKNRPPNIHFLDKKDVVPVSPARDVLLYPCPLGQKVSNMDPTAWIPKRDQETEGSIRIGVAHGSLDILGRQVNFPILPDRAAASDLDYLALGDWHSYFPYGDRTFYSGTPEPTGFEEKDAGQVLEVEIAGPGETPKVTPHRVATLTWEQQECSVATRDDLDRLLRQAVALPAPASTLWRLELKGVTDLDTYSAVREFEDQLASLLYFVDLRSELRPAASVQELEGLLPAGPVAEAALDLLELSEGRIRNDIARKYAQIDPSVARRALELLYVLGKEGSR